MKLTEELKTIIVREKLENYATTAEICKKYNLHRQNKPFIPELGQFIPKKNGGFLFEALMLLNRLD